MGEQFNGLTVFTLYISMCVVSRSILAGCCCLSDVVCLCKALVLQFTVIARSPDQVFSAPWVSRFEHAWR